MKLKYLFSGTIAISILISFVLRPDKLLIGAANGLLISAEVIIPSLFPFTALSLFLFNCGFLSFIEKTSTRIANRVFGLSGHAFCIFIISFLGGFPVGAKLIDSAVKNGLITSKTANRMICYCVNPGPAFVVIGIGTKILNNKTIGIIIFASNIITSILLATILSTFEKRTINSIRTTNQKPIILSDTFVNSVADACKSIISICGLIILFSSTIEVAKSIFDCKLTQYLIAFCEISNGTVLFADNIYFLSFLTSFSGFCVHMQILSVTKNYKFNYLRFLLSRILCGLFSTLMTFIIIKIFHIAVPTIAISEGFKLSLTEYSLPVSGMLIFMSITLLISIKQNNVEKRSNM